ncbi:glycosyl hydrolase family 18 protein [Streptomyces cinnabarinus]|uniref:chitinase n=1 Tax=Streptomyces cinnabarinus TaxID=67287 RepID=A0ABY7K6H1_9ACTN|nr:glycosyl hydrolase family 18 protein [Streptomyces cinnabarinus]WAZ19113.1 glycosyl hydrolase family 18 protein [Streptomyces cinnabarinus]
MRQPPPPRRPLRVLALLTALLLPLGVLVGLAPQAQAAAGVTATFTSQDNGSWWKGTFVIRNGSTTALDGWTLEFDLPAGVTVSGHYNGEATVNGSHVTVRNAYYNGKVAPGSSTEPYSYWFVASGPIGAPTGCTLNGDKCDGSADKPPGAPGTPRATTVTARTVTLDWSPATAGDHPVTSYEVLRGGTVVATSTSTSATVEGLTPAAAYTFTVRAKDARGNLGPASPPVTVTTTDPASDPQPPSAPGNLRSTGKTSTTVSLAWDAATDNVGVVAYDIYRGGTLYRTVAATTRTITVSGLSPATAYTFTVRARDAADNASAASNALSVTTDDQAAGRHLRVGYFAQWGIYGRQYFVKNLDTSGSAAKLDVINYAFENIDPVNLTCLAGVTKGTSTNPQDPDQGTGAGDAEADYARPFAASQSVDGVADTGWEKLRGNFNQIKKLKAKHPHLKVVVSLGGWTYSKFFTDAAATPASREKFVRSCIDVWIKGNLPVYNGAGGEGTAAGVFDGIDLDWEWPGSPDGHPGNHWSPQDKANNTALIHEFRKQLDELGGGHKLLTAFTPADPVKINAGWELDKIFTSLDFANVQGYDFHGAGSDNSWEPNRTGHQGNLYTDAQDPYTTHFSIENAVQPYLDAGVSPRKLTIGLPFYGRGWQGVADGGVRGEWQTANGAAPGQFAEEAGVRGYSNLLASVPGMTVYHDEQSVSTYGYTGAGGQWWSFDDAWSIGRKTTWLKQKGLLGVFIWEMSGDTSNGSLMTAIDSGLKG